LKRGIAKDAVLAPDRVAKVADVSIRQIARLDRLIDDMLDISRIASGTLSIHPEPADLGEIVRAVADRLAEALAAAQCRLAVVVQPGTEAVIDRFRIEQVVSNLLGNAMKYAAGAPVEVHVSRRDGSAVIEVRDSGPGVPKAAQARVFERYFRAVPHTHVTGFGLGLYIAEQIVQLHGGRITLESERGAGATFTVILPVGGAR
jgi:signal transduction histidine kinase